MLIKRAAWVGEEEVRGFKRPAGDVLGSDTETTGLDPWGTLGVDRQVAPARPFFFTFCDASGNLSWARCPVDARTRRVHVSRRVREAVETYSADDRLVKAFHNAPFDRRMIEASGIRVRGRVDCTQIRMHTIRPSEPTYRLKPLCKRYLAIDDDDEKALHASVVRARREAKRRGWAIAEEVAADYWLGDRSLLVEYGTRDAKRAVALYLAQEEHFNEEPSLRRVYERERKLMPVIAEMEDAGLAMDEDRLDELGRFYREIVAEHAGVIKREARGVNLRSPKQMTAFWFGQRGQTPVRYSTNKKKGGAPVICQHCRGEGCRICQGTGQNPKCDGEFLEHIGVRHEIGSDGQDRLVPGDRLAWAMLHNSAAQTMLDYIEQYRRAACREGDDLVIHPNVKQVGARTARMSCERPNLQNVASDESGKKKVDVPYRSREVFRPRRRRRFYVPDYSQIEVWILALLVFKWTGDRTLLDVLIAGGDAHQNVADLIWGHTYDARRAKRDARRDPKTLPPDALANLKRYKHARKKAKNLQFCKIYGGGAKKIASMIPCSFAEAKRFISEYDERLPMVQRFMDLCVAEARKSGKVVNPFGRVYHVDPGYEYRSTNYLIQGTAAEVMKNAMRRVAKVIKDKWRGAARILMQIHDELIIEVLRERDCPELRRDVVRAMAADARRLGCPVPFPVGFKIADERWSEARDVEVDVRRAA